MSEEEKKDIETLIKKLSYCELEYQQNGYLSVGKFNAIKQAIQVIEKQQKEIESIEKACNTCHEITEKEYISKDKIRDKIKELEEIGQMLTAEQGYWGSPKLLNQMEILKELLGENDDTKI